LGKITLENIDPESAEDINSKIKDQIMVTENVTSLEIINNAGSSIDLNSGISGDYINFSEYTSPSSETYIDVNHGYIQVSEKVVFFQGDGDAYYNSIIGTKGVDVISGDVEGVSIHYTGFEGDDIYLGGNDDVIDYGLEERMQEFFNSYYERPGVTVKLGDINTPNLDELIQNTTDIDTANLDSMIGGTARDTFGDTDTINGVSNVVGTSSADVLIGSKGDDELMGGRGDDFIYGQAGSDILTGGQGSDVFYYDINEREYGADTITDFNLLSDKLLIGGFDSDLSEDNLTVMSGEEMFGEGWQEQGDGLYKDYVVGIEKLSGDFDAILYLEDVNYSIEEVNLLLKDILTDVAA
jgi:Ca2+-binding RTX toxin-like protein